MEGIGGDDNAYYRSLSFDSKRVYLAFIDKISRKLLGDTVFECFPLLIVQNHESHLMLASAAPKAVAAYTRCTDDTHG